MGKSSFLTSQENPGEELAGLGHVSAPPGTERRAGSVTAEVDGSRQAILPVLWEVIESLFKGSSF